MNNINHLPICRIKKEKEKGSAQKEKESFQDMREQFDTWTDKDKTPEQIERFIAYCKTLEGIARVQQAKEEADIELAGWYREREQAYGASGQKAQDEAEEVAQHREQIRHILGDNASNKIVEAYVTLGIEARRADREEARRSFITRKAVMPKGAVEISEERRMKHQEQVKQILMEVGRL